MSEAASEDTDPPPRPPALRVVGYGQPPVEHQFRKGQSGNPAGRPKKTKRRVIDTGFGKNAANEMLLAEAYRPVMVREGEEVIELPALQAVFRAMGVSAMKGNRFAQRTMAELVKGVEEEHSRLMVEAFGRAIDYKREWEWAFARADALGKPRPEPVPHPDDIILDANKGTFRIAGPKTSDEKVDFDRLLDLRAKAQRDVSLHARKFKRARSEESREEAFAWWLAHQNIFDIYNDWLPERYKADLIDRSNAPEASKQGDWVGKLPTKNGGKRRVDG
jgi:hypothetical protein